MMETEQYFNKKYTTPTTETVFGPNNEILEATRGGLPGVAGVRPLLNMPAQGAATPAPRATPTTPAASAMDRAPSAASGAEMTFGPDATRPLNAYQQEDLRNLESQLGMQDTPASFTRGGMGAPAAAQMTPERAQQIVDSAVRSRVMAQEDFDQLMAMAPEQNKQPFMDMIQANNITLQPSGMGQQSQFAVNQGQRPQADFAVNRGAPPPATLAQTNVIGQQAYGRSASPVSAAPAESPEQAGRRSLLGRETAGEVYAKEKARAKAQREAALEAGPKPLTPVQEARLRENISKDYKTAADTIATMLHPETGVIAAVQRVRNLTPSQKEWLTGYSTYAPSLTNAGKQADTRFGNLVGKVTAMGRALASLSGSIGPMAVQEWDIVRKQIAEIDPVKLSPESLDEELDLIEAQARGAAARIRDAYENQYVEEFARYPGRFQLSDPGSTPVKKKTAESQIPRIRGNADYNRLKPGAEFIDPNGVRRRKPK
jgi:hypothetical protein